MPLGRLNPVFLALCIALAGAGIVVGQTNQAADTATGQGQSPPESIPSPPISVPPAAPLQRLPSVGVWDPPVPYYTQLQVADDVPDYDPLFELAPSQVKLGPIASVELAYVQPFIHNGLNSGGLAVGNLPTAVQVPSAQPGWLGLPRIDLGYRMEQGLGEFHAIFQFLGGEGTRTVSNFDAAGAGTVTSRLDVDVLDLDYAFTEFNPGRVARINPLLLIPGRAGLDLRPEQDPYPTFRMKWAYGARMANVFFDSRGSGGQILAERVTNNFVGAGLHASVDFSKPFPSHPAFEIYARFELSGLYGSNTQSFARTQIAPAATGSVQLRNINGGVPVLDVFAGLAYTPAWITRSLRITGGYRLQQWWYLGETNNSDAGLTLNGVFLRGEFGY